MTLTEYITSDTSPFKKSFHSAHELVLQQKISGSENGFFAFPTVSQFDLAPERLAQTIQEQAQRLNLAILENAWHITSAPVAAQKETAKRKQPWFGLFKARDSEVSISAGKRPNSHTKK